MAKRGRKPINYSGERHGNWLILRRDRDGRFHVQCTACRFTRSYSSLEVCKRGKCKQCTVHGHTIDETGNRYGRLTIIERAKTSQLFTKWRCRCDCGTIKEVLGYALRAGRVQSCGCLSLEVSRLPPKRRTKAAMGLLK